MRLLGEQYAEIRAFLESPQGRRESVRAFGDCLAEAIDAHRAPCKTGIASLSRLIPKFGSRRGSTTGRAHGGRPSGLTRRCTACPSRRGSPSQALRHTQKGRATIRRYAEIDRCGCFARACGGGARWNGSRGWQSRSRILLAASLLLSVARGRW